MMIRTSDIRIAARHDVLRGLGGTIRIYRRNLRSRELHRVRPQRNHQDESITYFSGKTGRVAVRGEPHMP